VHGVADEHWRGEVQFWSQHGDRAAGEHPEPIEQAGGVAIESPSRPYTTLAIDRVGGELGVGVDRVKSRSRPANATTSGLGDGALPRHESLPGGQIVQVVHVGHPSLPGQPLSAAPNRPLITSARLVDDCG